MPLREKVKVDAVDAVVDGVTRGGDSDAAALLFGAAEDALTFNGCTPRRDANDDSTTFSLFSIFSLSVCCGAPCCSSLDDDMVHGGNSKNHCINAMLPLQDRY